MRTTLALLLLAAAAGCTSASDLASDERTNGRQDSSPRGSSNVDPGAAPSDDDTTPPSPSATDGGVTPREDAGETPVQPRPGFFVMVGYGGMRYRSDDGITWTDGAHDTVQGGDDQYLLRDVVGGNGRVVAAGWKVKHSTDAKVWIDDPSKGQWFGGLTYAKGIFVGAGGWGRRSWSDDGIAWHDVDDTRTSAYRTIAYGNVMGGRWTAVGDKGMAAYSSDGKTWTQSSGDVTTGFSDIAYGNGVFVALGGGVISRSTDGGATWNKLNANLPGAEAIVYGPDGFYVMGGGNGSISSDGANWTKKGNAPGGTLAYGNGVYVAVNFQGNVNRSSDGAKWTKIGQITSGNNGVQRVRFVTP